LNFPNSNFLIFLPNVEFTYRTTTRYMQLNRPWIKIEKNGYVHERDNRRNRKRKIIFFFFSLLQYRILFLNFILICLMHCDLSNTRKKLLLSNDVIRQTRVKPTSSSFTAVLHTRFTQLDSLGPYLREYMALRSRMQYISESLHRTSESNKAFFFFFVWPMKEQH